jgi:hypothetical protein
VDIYSLVILHLHTRGRSSHGGLQAEDRYYARQTGLPHLRPVVLKSALTLGAVLFFGKVLM